MSGQQGSNLKSLLTQYLKEQVMLRMAIYFWLLAFDQKHEKVDGKM